MRRVGVALRVGAMGIALWMGASAAWSDDGMIVDCTFPGQVRRLGASATTVSPRRVAKATVAECRLGGGEYTEAAAEPPAPPTTAGSPAPRLPAMSSLSADPLTELNVWMPMAVAGMADAQVVVGELYERLGKADLAQSWYEKSAEQQNSRAQVNLAGLHEQRRDVRRAQKLIAQAAGLPDMATQGKPTVVLIDPPAALRLPRSNEVIRVGDPGAGEEVTVTGRAEALMGLSSVKVNGVDLAFDERGLFRAPVKLGAEPATLSVKVSDKAGATTSVDYVLQRGSASSIQADVSRDAFSGKRRALVIGNQAYRHWEKLDTPEADGQAVADMLRRRFGFQVEFLRNATRQDILSALGRLRSEAGPEDQVLVYYAGHGQMDPVTTRGYWIPVEAEVKDQSHWVSVIDVTDQLAAMQAKHVLVIADSCYSGTLAGSLGSRIDAALSAEQRTLALRQVARRRARVAFTSGGLEPVIDGGGGQHSLFARSLLDVLDRTHGTISAHELSSIVAARFSHLGQAQDVKQQPRYAPIAFAGHEAGDFVLSAQPIHAP